jgi:hypothetical protein
MAELPKRDMGLLDMLLDRIRLTCRIGAGSPAGDHYF